MSLTKSHLKVRHCGLNPEVVGKNQALSPFTLYTWWKHWCLSDVAVLPLCGHNRAQTQSTSTGSNCFHSEVLFWMCHHYGEAVIWKVTKESVSLCTLLPLKKQTVLPLHTNRLSASAQTGLMPEEARASTVTQATLPNQSALYLLPPPGPDCLSVKAPSDTTLVCQSEAGPAPPP